MVAQARAALALSEAVPAPLCRPHIIVLMMESYADPRQLDPGFVLVPQDRYEELIRAETERDVLEATIKGENSYNVDRVLAAIQKARKAAWLKVSAAALNAEGAPEAGSDAE